MQLTLVVVTVVFCSTVFCSPIPVALEEEFNLPGFHAKQENHEEKFLRVDQNKDKKLSFDEFLHMELAYVDAKKEEFDSLDKNMDGIITLKEYEEHYHGVTNRSEARRTEYFGKVFQDFDDDFDMQLSQDELERVLAERFLVKPRENFPKLFYAFDHDHSGGLDLTEYMKFDASFPFDQTDPISNIEDVKSKSGTQVFSNHGIADEELSTISTDSFMDDHDQEAIEQVMAQASPTLKAHDRKKSHSLKTSTSTDLTIHPVEPGPSQSAVPIRKIVKVSKSI